MGTISSILVPGICDSACNTVSFQIQDLSKAVQAATQFAMDEKAVEKKIYTQKICSTCSGKKSKQKIVIELYPKQMAFLRYIPQAYAVSDKDVSSARLRDASACFTAAPSSYS